MAGRLGLAWQWPGVPPHVLRTEARRGGGGWVEHRVTTLDLGKARSRSFPNKCVDENTYWLIEIPFWQTCCHHSESCDAFVSDHPAVGYWGLPVQRTQSYHWNHNINKKTGRKLLSQKQQGPQHGQQFLHWNDTTIPETVSLVDPALFGPNPYQSMAR